MSKVTDSDTKSDSSDIESLLSCNDPSKLVPYSVEPLASSKDEDIDSEGNVQQQSSSNSRIGNTEWCKCNNCWQMETDAESFCCAEADEIHKGKLFEGKLTLCVLLISHSTMPLFQDIYSNKLSLRLICLMFFNDFSVHTLKTLFTSNCHHFISYFFSKWFYQSQEHFCFSSKPFLPKTQKALPTPSGL